MVGLRTLVLFHIMCKAWVRFIPLALKKNTAYRGSLLGNLERHLRLTMVEPNQTLSPFLRCSSCQFGVKEHLAALSYLLGKPNLLVSVATPSKDRIV